MKRLSSLSLVSVLWLSYGCEKGFFAQKDQSTRAYVHGQTSEATSESHPETTAVHSETAEAKSNESSGGASALAGESSVHEGGVQAQSEASGAAASAVVEPVATELPKNAKSNKGPAAAVVEKKPAFLSKECGAANEGEMGYHPGVKRAFYCDGMKWVNLPKSAFSGVKTKSNFSWDVVQDASFLCQKSAEGSFRCMKGGTFKQAH